MPKVYDAARVTCPDGAVWRHCAGCGSLAPLAPDAEHCRACRPVDSATLTRAQVEGRACVICEADLFGRDIVAGGYLPGWGNVFACATHADTARDCVGGVR